MDPIDQRESPRYAIALACEITAGEQKILGQSKDLSRGGISLSAPSPLEVSQEVELSISLVFGDNTFSEPLRVPAMVVWSTKLGAAYQIGAKFLRPTPETRNFLDLFLRFLEGDPEGEDEETDPPPASRAGKRRRR